MNFNKTLTSVFYIIQDTCGFEDNREETPQHFQNCLLKVLHGFP